MKFYSIRNFAKKNRELGKPYCSEYGLWGLRKNCAENGFAEAFIMVGRKLLVYESKFWEAYDLMEKK